MLAQWIKDEAKSIGFIACGISKAKPLSGDNDYLEQWIGKGMHGTMSYMERNVEKRLNPLLLVAGAKTIISLAVNYYPERLQNPDLPQIAKYAYGKDYHNVVKDMLHQLLGSIRKKCGDVSGRAFVDSAPVREKTWAACSGLGWIGKHSLLIHPDFGSYVVFGELIIDLEVGSDRPVADQCGNCSRCIDACPVQAIVAPHVVDARKCISYLTVEYQEEFDPSVSLHNRLFGCDICQDVCPYNKDVKPTNIIAFTLSDEVLDKTAEDWLQMKPEVYQNTTKGMSLSRASVEMIRRNAKKITEETVK